MKRFSDEALGRQIAAEQIVKCFRVLTIVEYDGPDFMRWMRNEIFLLRDFRRAVKRAGKLNRRPREPGVEYVVAEVMFTGRIVSQME